MTKRPARRAIEFLASSPWYITDTALDAMLEIANREQFDPAKIAAAMHGPERPDALATREGAELEETRSVTVRDGVATLPIVGPMFRHADFFSNVSGATTYENLAREFTAALESSEVRAILLDIDSPGGEAQGASELAAIFAAARGKKPVWAYVGAMGASAAYWLAAAADRIVVNELATVGSVGARARFNEQLFREDQRGERGGGRRTTELVAKQSPRKNGSMSDTQVMVDALAAVFISGVAELRGVTEEKVLSDFGQGGLFLGAGAVEAGLADAIGTYESVHAELVAKVSPTNARGSVTANMRGGPSGVRFTLEDRMKQPELTTDTPPVTTPAPDGSAPKTEEPAPAPTPPVTPPVTTAAPASSTDGVAEALVAAATAERERIVAILEVTQTPVGAVATEAIKDPACTHEQAAVRLLAASRAQGDTLLDRLRKDEATLKAPPAEAETAASTPKTVARQVVSDYLKLTTTGSKPRS